MGWYKPLAASAGKQPSDANATVDAQDIIGKETPDIQRQFMTRVNADSAKYLEGDAHQVISNMLVLREELNGGLTSDAKSISAAESRLNPELQTLWNKAHGTSPEGIAGHEAGHAVVAHKHGATIESIRTAPKILEITSHIREKGTSFVVESEGPITKARDRKSVV